MHDNNHTFTSYKQFTQGCRYKKEIFYHTKMVFIRIDGDQRRQVSNQNVKQLRRVMFASLANNHQQFIRIFKFPLEEVHQSYVPM